MRPRDYAVGAVFAGPAAAFADQVASYALVEHRAALVASTVLAALATLIGAATSVSVLRSKIEVFPVDRFLGWSGVALNAFFLLLILAGYGIPKLLL